MDAKRDDKFGKREAKKRMDDALRGAFQTPPTPMASLPRKRKKRKVKTAKKGG